MGSKDKTYLVLKLFKEEYLKEYDKCLDDPAKADEREKYEQKIFLEVANYLVSHHSLPKPLFANDSSQALQIPFSTEKNQAASLIKTVGTGVKEAVGQILDYSKKIQNKEDIGAVLWQYKDNILQIGGIASKWGLVYFGYGLIALSFLLQEDQTQKLKDYVDKVAQALREEMDMKLLKLAMDDLKSKISAIQTILFSSDFQKISKADQKGLILSLFYPCEEIYQKITSDGCIYKKFSFYTFEIVVLFFVLELGLLGTARDEFGIDIKNKLEKRCSEYPIILEEYLRLMSDQRPQLKIDQKLSMTKVPPGAFLIAWGVRKMIDKDFHMRYYVLKDELTGEEVCTYFKYPSRSLAEPDQKNKYFNDAFKVKFGGCLSLLKHCQDQALLDKGLNSVLDEGLDNVVDKDQSS